MATYSNILLVSISFIWSYKGLEIVVRSTRRASCLVPFGSGARILPSLPRFILTMLLNSEDDIHGPVVVFDMEWMGDTKNAQHTHVYDIACACADGERKMQSYVFTMCSDTAFASAPSAKTVYTSLVNWLYDVKGDQDCLYLTAHNAFRSDAPVLYHNMMRAGVSIPDWLLIMDSLHHFRYHMRHQKNRPKFDLHSLAQAFDITFDLHCMHAAQYDANVLLALLCKFRNDYKVPFITGAVHPLNKLSTMLVRGIGPVVFASLPDKTLLDMCSAIIKTHGNLSEQSCEQYFEDIQLKLALPLCNTNNISQDVANAARRHLQYLEVVQQQRC